MAQSHDASRNIMGRAHTNPILNTRMYQVEFAGGKITDIIANIIAESLYAQCDAERNEFLLLDVQVDYHKDNKAIPLSDQ